MYYLPWLSNLLSIIRRGSETCNCCILPQRYKEDMVVPWGYRRKHPFEFRHICSICPDERRFKREKDLQLHNDMTKRHSPDFVSISCSTINTGTP